MNPYRQRLWKLFQTILSDIETPETALDFGSGDGAFARLMTQSGAVKHLTAIDVKRRPNVEFEPQLYDGGTLPFTDAQFDLTYAVDVLHHCPDPPAQLDDVLRCTRRYFLLKDHNYRTAVGRLELAILDEIGNRRFGIPSLYRYQRRWEWNAVFERHGFKRRRLIYPAPCHVGVLGKLTNPLQFVALWERQGASS